jgi:predicted membrane channel-forming protein YqfA (hemolysin III family)
MELITPTALQHFGAAIAYSLLGITLFFACFVIIDKLTPRDRRRHRDRRGDRVLTAAVGGRGGGLA